MSSKKPPRATKHVARSASLHFWSMPEEGDVPEVVERLVDVGIVILSVTDGGPSDLLRFRVWCWVPNKVTRSGRTDEVDRSIEEYLKGGD